MEDEVIKILSLSEDDVSDLHRGNTTKLSYRLAWARTYLKRVGLLDNSARGVWTLTQKGIHTKSVNKKLVKDFVKDEMFQLSNKDINNIDEENTNIQERFDWKDSLLELIQNIS